MNYYDFIKSFFQIETSTTATTITSTTITRRTTGEEEEERTIRFGTADTTGAVPASMFFHSSENSVEEEHSGQVEVSADGETEKLLEVLQPINMPRTKAGKAMKKAAKEASQRAAKRAAKRIKKKSFGKLPEVTLAEAIEGVELLKVNERVCFVNVDVDADEMQLMQRALELPPRTSLLCRSKSISHMPRPNELLRQREQRELELKQLGELELVPLQLGEQKVENIVEDDCNETPDEDCIHVSDGTDEESAVTPPIYVMESQSEYRRGGYHPVTVGECFHQRYYALRKLGWGHYSTVWLCFDTQRDRYCAVKVIKSAELYAESARQEVLLLRHLSQFNWHPLRNRVVNMTDNFAIHGVNGKHQCIVFDGLGENMLMLIQRSGYQGLPLYNVKQIAYQVLQGLVLLHEKARLIHTDLKPENVLLVTDDVTFRTYSNEASRKYIDEQSGSHTEEENDMDVEQEPQHQQPQMQRLSKTAKRKLRSRIKQTASFFYSHRKWLRNRGMADLLVLAHHGLLTPPAAADAVTGKLPWLAFDSPQILSEAQHQTAVDSERFTEQVGDNAAGGVLNDEPSMVGIKRRKRSHDKENKDKALKLLRTDMEKFIRYVIKCIENAEKDEPHYLCHKRAKLKRSSKKRIQPSYSFSPDIGLSNEPNMNLLECKDPAQEPCELQVAIADVGNSCFIDNHVTEDIQTREYRSVEVILGAGYDTSADIWSAACLFWELATGEYLFDPSQWRDHASQDEVHIAHIIETCGPIPREMIKRGKCSREIFDEHGKLLHVRHLKERRLDQVLIDNYGWNSENALEFAQFLTPLLILDPKSRISAADALNDPWLKLDD